MFFDFLLDSLYKRELVPFLIKKMQYFFDGSLLPCDITYEGKPVFRKYTHSEVELKVAELLKENPCEDIVDIYKVDTYFFDMELVRPNNRRISAMTKEQQQLVVHSLENAKQFLQEHNVVYFDWKEDNFGFNDNGECKLFDFDACGIFSEHDSTIWNHAPSNYYVYNKYKDMFQDPRRIDNLAFIENILGNVKNTE